MTAPLAAPKHLPADLKADWRRLITAREAPPGFDLAMLDGLPPPVQRWLRHAIAPRTPLRTTVAMKTHGEIFIGRWARYDADWLLAPPEEFIWAATARLLGVPVRGFDKLTHHQGQMRWRIAGLVPVMSAGGDDVSRSAAGRLAAECCFAPAAALSPHVRWQPLDESRAVATIDAAGWPHDVTITVHESGALRRLQVPRWNNHDGKEYREHLFTAVLSEHEDTVDGFTIPTGARAGWWECPDGCADEEFFRLTITDRHYT